MTKHQLIGAEVSLYTGKLRCYLQYKNIPFEEIVASQDVFKNVILPRTGVSYIPIFITDEDNALQDTTEIIDALETRYKEQPVYPATPKQNLVSLLLETYGDEWLVIPAMHYRWNKPENREFAIGEFGRTSAPQASQDEQLAIGAETAKPFAGALPRLGVISEAVPAIEESYLALLAELDTHFAQHPFLLGTKPCMGDFGLIGPLYAHLYRDPYSGRLMEQHAPNVVAWVKRMIDPTPLSGEFLANDDVPDTLLPVLQRMLNEQGTVLKQTIDQVANWAKENDSNTIERVIGKSFFTIEDTNVSRLTFPYMQWMWQRCYDFYHAQSDKADIKKMLSSVNGFEDLLNYPVQNRIKRVNNKMEVER
ncbi:hypothetical protein NBRC116188_10500 [Oceaniserpentilla sp. 4NH20-0058]|uniref:glutathione S-transferase family protein n=1 Tax=Oceaniserpentilla sp. 4NH20-0058 TaxID=3127660 RepID=UPI0031043233